MVTAASDGTVVELHGISKSYGATRANVDIDFDLRAGEIHVLLGENGAGKTTLMNVMFGHVLPDAGTIRVRGADAAIHSPHDALELGIGMVHQHFSLVPTFSVAENIVLGSRPAMDLRFRRGAIGAETSELAERFGMPIAPHVAVGDLPVDLQQRVEILKVLYRGATILILDEPTSLLGPRQIENLLEILRDLRDRGCSIVLVTHKLGEVMEVADRVTVLRGGEKVSTTERGAFDERSLTRAMTGHDIAAVESDHAPWTDDVPMLEVRELNAPGEGADHLDSISLMVRPGEILGVAGVEGNGQRTLVNCVCGLESAESGGVWIAGEDVTGAGTSALRSAGLAVIPEDRHTWGLILDMTVAENIAMSDIPAGAYSKTGLLDWRGVRRRARRLLEEYDVRPPDPDLLASSLSGGNQQKVVLARELSREPRVLLADNPTWGLDVGAIDYVHRRLLDVKHSGAAVLLLSMDLEELLKLSDRLIVLFRGRIVLERSIGDLDMDELALAMAGRSATAAV
ncbi:MAG: ABC transporter ATP-binding protein [bacterium]|nr:ABC transporter ATP-binding protein [bacterium]